MRRRRSQAQTCATSISRDSVASQLHRRREIAMRALPLDIDRSAPLDCLCRDPWTCRCHEKCCLTEQYIDSWRYAVLHLLALGITPGVPATVAHELQGRTDKSQGPIEGRR